jgi:purine-binding chemotaxis protein CheW
MMDQHHMNSALLVRVPGAVCALPLAEVIETMRPMPLEPLANTSDFILGITLIRGAAVPVIDLTAVFNNPSRRSCERFVTVRVGTGCVALAVQSVIGIFDLSNRNCESMPPLLKNARTEVVEAIGSRDAELLFVLQAARLVPDSVWKAIQKVQAAP